MRQDEAHICYVLMRSKFIYSLGPDLFDLLFSIIGNSEQGIVGKESTPFLLKRVNELTGGNSLKSSMFCFAGLVLICFCDCMDFM